MISSILIDILLFCLIHSSALAGNNLSVVEQHDKVCLFTVDFDFDRCSQTRGVIFYKINVTESCPEEDICRKTFNISMVNIEPFTDATLSILDRMLSHCCGKCYKRNIIENLEKETDVKSTMTSDFIFPVLGKTTIENMYGFSFLPMMKVPTGYFFIKKVSGSEIMLKAVIAVVDLWPFFIISILMAFVFGFLCWLIEKGKNTDEFPKPFPSGMVQGFWWAFVSMTTVGYGDKAPKTVLSRLIAVVWILMGITICSTFTATLTDGISKSKIQPTPVVAGKIVGALKSRILDATIISHHGGNIKSVKEADLFRSVDTIYSMLEDDKIDGFLLDRYTYYHLEMYNYTIYEKIHFNTIRQELPSDDSKRAYGVLVKNHEDYHYFRHYMDDNWMKYEACTEFMMNVKEPVVSTTTDFLSPDGEFFFPALYISIGVIACILLFGIIYEIIRKRKLGAPAGCI